MISEHILKTHFNTTDNSNNSSNNFSQLGLTATQYNIEELTLTQRIRRRIKEVGNNKNSIIPPHLFKRYIEYAKKFVHPRLTKPAAKILQKLYLTMRSEASL